MNPTHDSIRWMRDMLLAAVQWSHTRAASLNKENNELEQAVIRVVITVLVALYGLGYVRSMSAGSPLEQQVWIIFGTYAAFTLVSLCWVYSSPAPNIIRRIIAMIADISILSYAMAVSGEHGAAWYPAYLWVTFGNGFRYGTAYLHAASALSVIGFGIVVLYSPFWGRYSELGAGLAIGLIILPIYVSKLLRRLESAIKSADAAKTEAEHANHEKSRFLANMSHELRTPLNGVIATSDILCGMQLNRETNDLVHTIQSSAQTLLVMINGILDIGKIESGRMDIEHTSFHLRSTLLNIHKIMFPLANRKEIGLKLYCDTAIPDNLVGDPGHIKQILLNIIGNAIKFTERGAVSVRVELDDTIPEESVCARFTISDSGIGIPEDARERIFDAFTQASSSITRTHGGTGLGVTIAKELTELMGGTISLDSQVGIGTTFCLTIPFKINPEPDAVYLVKRALVMLIGPDSTSSHRIFNMLIELGLPEHAIKWVSSLDGIKNIIEAQPELSPVIMFDANINHFESILNELNDSSPESRFIPSIAFNVTNDLLEYIIRAGVSAGLDTETVEPKTLKRAIECCVNSYETPVHELDIKHEPHRTLRILAADDNKINRDVLYLTLSRAGHMVDLVNSGDEALRLLMDGEYDIVILDMNMGEISGLSVIQEYKMLFPASTLPFILLTADATEEAQAIADESGFSRYITKPFRAEALVAAVEDVATNSAGNSINNEVSTEVQTLPTEENLIDEITIHSLRMLANSDHGFLKKLYEDYITDAATLITKMEVSLISHQYEDFLDIAHALKGSSGHIGARIVYQRCTELSDISVSEISEQGPDLLKRISEAVRRTNDPLFHALCGDLGLHHHG